MTERKPHGESVESWVERQILQAQERGAFDDLPGAGKPIPDLHVPYDELWWVRQKLRRENVAYVPPALQFRKDVQEAREQVATARSERHVRRIVADINERIRNANRLASDGPATMVVPLDEEKVVRDWRERHAPRSTPPADGARSTPDGVTPAPADGGFRRRWLPRRRRP